MNNVFYEAHTPNDAKSLAEKFRDALMAHGKWPGDVAITYEDKAGANEMILTRQSLSEMRCSKPGCTECDDSLVFSRKCHPKKGVTVIYEKACGHLRL
jgi:hypothetical protein